jgi:hypothetical protein
VASVHINPKCIIQFTNAPYLVIKEVLQMIF